MASQGHLPTPPPPPPPLPPPSPRIPLKTNPPGSVLTSKPLPSSDDTPSLPLQIRPKKIKLGFVQRMIKLFSGNKSKRRNRIH